MAPNRSALVKRAVTVRTKHGIVNQMRMVRAAVVPRKRSKNDEEKPEWGKFGVVVGGAVAGAVAGAFGARAVAHATVGAVGRTARGVGWHTGSHTVLGQGRKVSAGAAEIGRGASMFGAMHGLVLGAEIAAQYVSHPKGQRGRAAGVTALAGAQSMGARVAGSSMGNAVGSLVGGAAGAAIGSRRPGGGVPYEVMGRIAGSVVGAFAGGRIGMAHERATLAAAGLLVGGNTLQSLGSRVPGIYRGVRNHFTRQPTRTTTVSFAAPRGLPHTTRRTGR